jgi:hypothetical protein
MGHLSEAVASFRLPDLAHASDQRQIGDDMPIRKHRNCEQPVQRRAMRLAGVARRRANG